MAYFNQDDRQDRRGSFGPRRDFGGRGRQDRRMYPAVCDKCGRECQVPFSPDGSKPVYCSDCFEKNQPGFGQRRNDFGGRQFNDRNKGQDQNKELLVSINSKLGQILELMRNGNKAITGQEIVEIKVKKKAKKTKAKKNKKDK